MPLIFLIFGIFYLKFTLCFWFFFIFLQHKQQTLNMEEKKPLDVYFLKAILKEQEIPVNESSLTKKLQVMMDFSKPEMEMNDDYSMCYTVNFSDVKDLITNEEEAFNLRSHGWVLDSEETKIVLHI